jgi:transposase
VGWGGKVNDPGAHDRLITGRGDRLRGTVLKATGRPGYAPTDLLKLYIYGYLNRVRSS